MRGFVIGTAVGTLAAILWALETTRRDTERDRARGHLWPRPDGTVRSCDEIWNRPIPAEMAAVT